MKRLYGVAEDEGRPVAAVKRVGDGRAREMGETVGSGRAMGEGESEVDGCPGEQGNKSRDKSNSSCNTIYIHVCPK